eukprot:s1711_g6.t1
MSWEFHTLQTQPPGLPWRKNPGKGKFVSGCCQMQQSSFRDLVHVRVVEFIDWLLKQAETEQQNFNRESEDLFQKRQDLRADKATKLLTSE